MVTCIALPVAFALIVLVSELLTAGSTRAPSPLDAVAGSLLIGWPISAIAMYLFALPVLMVFRKRGLLGFLTACALTTLVGALILPGVLGLIFGGPFNVVLMAWGAGFGAGAGVIFCLVAGIPWRQAPPKVLISNT